MTPIATITTKTINANPSVMGKKDGMGEITVSLPYLSYCELINRFFWETKW